MAWKIGFGLFSLDFFYCFRQPQKIELLLPAGIAVLDLSRPNRPMSFVRGTKIHVVAVPSNMTVARLEERGLKVGDKLTVSSRKKNGWLRAKNARTDKVISLRVGTWLQIEASNWGRKPVTQPPKDNSTTLTNTLRGRRGFQDLVCDSGTEDPANDVYGPVEFVNKTQDNVIADMAAEIQRLKLNLTCKDKELTTLRNLLDLNTKITLDHRLRIEDGQKQIIKLQRQNQAWALWHRKYTESTGKDAWELVQHSETTYHNQEAGSSCITKP